MRQTKGMFHNTEHTHSQVGRGDSDVSLWGWIFFKIERVMWSLSTSYREITLFFSAMKTDCPQFLKVDRSEKNNLILFQKFKWCFTSNFSTSWEKFQMRAEGPHSASRVGGSRIPGLRRRAAWPGAAGWYNPWGCQHLLQIHSVKSESARNEEKRTMLFLSGKVTKEVANTYTEIRGEGACSLTLFF